MKRHPLISSFILVCLLGISGCSKSTDELHQQRIFVFGTNLDITIWGAEPEVAQQAMEKLSSDFRDMHRSWHAWESSDLTRLNADIKSGVAHKLKPGIAPLIPIAKNLFETSDGLFNPTIGRLIALWGFHSSERPNGPPPSPEAIRELVGNNPGMDDLTIKEGKVTSTNRYVQMDFGGFAKGYGIDLAMKTLQGFGIKNAIINAGGDLRAIGKKNQRSWRIGVRHPQGKGILASIEIDGDESVYTSGNYERYNEHEGVRYPHILDSRTGLPVQGITSVTVIHDNGSVADAAATALVVAGASDWHRIAQRMGIRYAMVVDDSGTVYMNPRMKQRVQFSDPAPANIVVSDPL